MSSGDTAFNVRKQIADIQLYLNRGLAYVRSLEPGDVSDALQDRLRDMKHRMRKLETNIVVLNGALDIARKNIAAGENEQAMLDIAVVQGWLRREFPE